MSRDRFQGLLMAQNRSASTHRWQVRCRWWRHAGLDLRCARATASRRERSSHVRLGLGFRYLQVRILDIHGRRAGSLPTWWEPGQCGGGVGSRWSVTLTAAERELLVAMALARVTGLLRGLGMVISFLVHLMETGQISRFGVYPYSGHVRNLRRVLGAVFCI